MYNQGSQLNDIFKTLNTNLIISDYTNEYTQVKVIDSSNCLIMKKELTGKNRIFNIFDIEERIIDDKNNCLQIRFRSSHPLEANLSDIKDLINSLHLILGKDLSYFSTFCPLDEARINSQRWFGRSWSSVDKPKFNLRIHKDSSIFEMIIIFSV